MWRHHNGRIRIGLPVWPPVGSEGDDEARADEDPRPSMPMAFMPMASMSMPLVPMPTTVGMSWYRADQEQHGGHDEYAYPRLASFMASPLCSRGCSPAMRRLTSSVPTIGPA